MNFFNCLVWHPDLGKLILRLSFGVMFLLHGIHKIGKGTGYIEKQLLDIGLPTFIAYGVYVGEVLVPVLLIIGLFTRFAAFVGVGTCAFILLLAHRDHLFALNQYGAWAVESAASFLFAFAAIMFLGSGRFAVKPD